MQRVRIAGGKVTVEDARRARRPRGHALLALRVAGICSTDLELQRGYYGFAGVPGHEFVADVVACDDPRWLGKRVVGEINLACTRCAWCRRGLGRHCPTRSVLGIVRQPGAFQSLFTLPERNLHRVPDALSDEQAVFVEPLAAACEILEQVRIERGARVAVLGDGKLAQLVARVLLVAGADVALYGRHAHKLALARRAGASARRAGKRLPRKAFELVVDATGSAQGLAQAVAMCAPRGTVVMKSTVHDRVELDSAPVIVDELTLVGSRCGPFAPALALLARGAVRVDDLVADEYALAHARRAFERAAERGVLKVLLRAAPAV
ncbi:MAG: alcohol dehydrogenase [Planctomycetota bacterium]|nr:MAG: alcohol dehydrogenase [Planctomycetota bacterium]